MISCDQHDYIEIVCMYRYPVELTLKSGEIIQGIAVDIILNDQKEECIKLDVNNTSQNVILTSLHKLRVCAANPHFDQIQFDKH